jgi:uncharacterized SAM-binding protein YcdF (DUF218 family)
MREVLSYSFVMPPTIFIVICLAGALISLIRPRIGIVITLVSSISLYLFATPIVFILLLQQLVSLIPTKIDLTSAQAIVVPCVDVKWGNGADLPDAVGVLTLERLASAARLYRRLRLPIVVSGGGALDHQSVSVASLMRQELENNFSVPVQFVEEKSHNTFENAFYTTNILKPHGVNNVIIVAQARDMPRLLWSFSRMGLHPQPFALDMPLVNSDLGFTRFFPSATVIPDSFYALHEIIGIVYYRMFYQ